MELWPQWRIALVWDFWAILSYLLFSILFWYIGLLPDLATMRDRATSRGRAGALRRLRARLARLGPALAAATRPCTRPWRRSRVPLVCSVHSIVGLDFAASLMPGWQESIFPPYFVVGAMYSGFAMVVLLAICDPLGPGPAGHDHAGHFDVMAKIMLMASIVMSLSYATEWFMAWYGGERADRSCRRATCSRATMRRSTGRCSPATASCRRRCGGPRSRGATCSVLAVIAIVINIGMWLERILIIWNTLSHGYMP